ncbi:Ubiquitin-like-specific protease 1 [Wickerhamomyces ciferrii]|uniref:Ubiquitin-like-specific protease 1 n=1 Tax=Wickerhamomyces ciferrii (strain ATCC 14091 / BCRC 22168 / CBS 111 / JCM 3599 / NBRC 0793 / NRRL Y-1031 F-60-10) TaxID=1206466 RepID=K0KRE4_WICCF|nr:Ubiquitin-like-specific protease 1 [Wickerhamomyces ciferrii]CCH43883.1 Ubiquitin-like-specific protease 1 [Wickerhamomyces ciferrii]
MSLERKASALGRKRKRNTEFNPNVHSNRKIITSSHLHKDSTYSTPIKPKSVPENFSRSKKKDWTNVGQDKQDQDEDHAQGFAHQLFSKIMDVVSRKTKALIYKHETQESPDETNGAKKRKVHHSEKKQERSNKSSSKLNNKNLEQTLEKNPFNPDIKDDYKNVSFTKSPIEWDLKEDLKKNAESSNGDYGSTFYRRKVNKKIPNSESKYLRSLYNGHYKAPSPSITTPPTPRTPVEDDKRLLSSLQTLTEDLRKNWGNKVKRATDDDVIIVKEVKLPPATPSSYSLTFDTTRLTFENEFKYYQRILNEKRKIQDEIKKDKLEAETASKLIQKLSDNDEEKVVNIWKSRGKDTLTILQAFNIDVRVMDFKTLADKHWLNDVVIELFLKSLITDKVYAFNSYFFTTLENKGYQGVNRWMKRAKVNISNLDKVLVPINVHQTHWVLGVIDLKNKKVLYMDSLATRKTPHGERALNLMYEFVKGETNKQGVPKLAEGYTFEHLLDVPQQQNGFDCGVFTLLNAFHISKNEPLSYQPSDATLFRRIIGHTILGMSPK